VIPALGALAPEHGRCGLKSDQAPTTEGDSVSPTDADMMAQRDSTFSGMLTLPDWVYLAINHDLMRLAQFERLKTCLNCPAE